MSYGYLANCKHCNGEFQSRMKNRLQKAYCSRNCRILASEARKGCRPNPYAGLPTATIGALNELRVAIDLLMRGYEVFRALSPSCSCDLAILKDGKLSRIEVKTGYARPDGTIPLYKRIREHRADILALALPDKIHYEPSL